MRICSIEGCEKKHVARGYCDGHYTKLTGIYQRRLEREKAERRSRPEYIERKRKISARNAEITRQRLLRKDPFMLRYRMAVSEAKTKAHVRRGWNLSFEEFKAVASRPCYYCDSFFPGVKYGKGLDRVDNDRGYEVGNIISACYQCNATRSNKWTVEETRVMIQAVIHLRTSRKVVAA